MLRDDRFGQIAKLMCSCRSSGPWLRTGGLGDHPQTLHIASIRIGASFSGLRRNNAVVGVLGWGLLISLPLHPPIRPLVIP